jgi:hypothetical protein
MESSIVQIAHSEDYRFVDIPKSVISTAAYHHEESIAPENNQASDTQDRVPEYRLNIGQDAFINIQVRVTKIM